MKGCQKGFSIIEFMISSALGLILISIVVGFYQHQRAQYRHQENMALIQDNARFAIQALQTGIQVAGYVGCKSLFEEIIEGNPNSIIVRHMNTQSTELLSVPKRGDRVLSVVHEKEFKKGDEILIGDCQFIQNATVIEQSGKQLVLSTPIKHVFAKEAQVGRWIVSKFYLADKNLYWQDLGRKHAPAAIVEGVENMTIRYGMFFPPKLKYQSVVTGKESENVRLVQITLVLSAEKLRREWETQIVLRGRL